MSGTTFFNPECAKNGFDGMEKGIKQRLMQIISNFQANKSRSNDKEYNKNEPFNWQHAALSHTHAGGSLHPSIRDATRLLLDALGIRTASIAGSKALQGFSWLKIKDCSDCSERLVHPRSTSGSPRDEPANFDVRLRWNVSKTTPAMFGLCRGFVLQGKGLRSSSLNAMLHSFLRALEKAQRCKHPCPIDSSTTCPALS